MVLDIATIVSNIRAAIFGKDVRDSIADGIQAISDKADATQADQDSLQVTFSQLVINAGNTNAEIVTARNGEVDLSTKLGKMDSASTSNLQQIKNVNLKLLKTPAFLEQYITGFYGRGQLSAETSPESIATEQNATTARSAGYGGIDLANTTYFTAGSICTIKYDDGTYSTHWVTAVSGTALSLKPSLLKDITTNTKVERCWFNGAHPGKFYMRYLAQRLANATETECGYGETIFYANFDGISNDDIGVALGGATIGYNDSINKASTYDLVLESCVGKIAYFSTSAVGGGIKLPEFAVKPGEKLVLRTFAMSRNADNTTKVAIVNSSSIEVASFTVTGVGSQIIKPYILEFVVPYDTTRCHLEVTNQSTGLPTNVFFIDEVRVMRNVEKGNVLPSVGTIVCLGDSWIAGDLGNSAEREPITTHLAELLPSCTIINKGVGGNKVQDLLARFDTDVTPNSPDVVIINTATNDVYNPASGVFDPNSIDYYAGRMQELIQKCIDIGAKPVVIGPPALAEVDVSFVNFELNDKSRLYCKRLYRNIYPDNHGLPKVKSNGSNRYGKLENDGIYLAGNNYKDVFITIGSTSVKIKRLAIQAKAFNATTSANVTLKIYDATRTTVLATSDTKTIEQDTGIQKVEFTLPSNYSLAANTSYILAFEGTALWSVNEGGAGTKNYGTFSITQLKADNTTPPATVFSKWIGVLLIPPVGTQKIFVNSIPGRYTTSPVLTDIDQDTTINILDDNKETLLSFFAKLGEEFDYSE